MTRQIELKRGAHTNREDGMCLMEAVAFVAGEEHSDHPQCTCPVLAAFARGLNDGMDDETRQVHLAPLISMLVGTREPGLEQKRAYVLADFAVREAAVFVLDAANIPHNLGELDPIVDATTADAAAYEAYDADAVADAVAAADAAVAAADAAAWAWVGAVADAAVAAADAAVHVDATDVWEAAVAALIRAIKVTK